MTATATAAKITTATDAQRVYADQKEELQAEIDTATRMFAREAEKATKAEIAEALGRDAKGTKADMVTAYAKNKVSHTHSDEYLRFLEGRAIADDLMVNGLNRLLANETEMTAEYVQAVQENPLHALAWKTDRLQTAVCAARYAHLIKQALEAGNTDLPALVKAIAKDAVRAVHTFPSYVLSNGLSGNMKSDELFGTLGAGEFLRLVSRAYAYQQPEELTFSLVDLSL